MIYNPETAGGGGGAVEFVKVTISAPSSPIGMLNVRYSDGSDSLKSQSLPQGLPDVDIYVLKNTILIAKKSDDAGSSSYYQVYSSGLVERLYRAGAYDIFFEKGDGTLS